ncbi:glycoside hydrolase family 13 protein [Aestuariimicrobium sp. T2.26MG-19.2B]|uniref:glycoside hydrolase family 13 protein n=1 Tax=Aestuariimicrobium sp. T2.26MG-19.2B TaxID=3040679 RepID=UPI00247792EA|nr:glycoside hydrolase family 13 protein [Aestuariimicrobium sp. T2.26MG-19.2B]CAI9403769.1 Oligo-1,6-glucosidase [Aestuariimicrobium sp. T2.26MG-19.2B]
MNPAAVTDADWYRQAVVYQIYPRSFADANGDGLGDLAGITSRVDHLVRLGIDAVWLSPFYPSALADGGYDVDDYRNVDPRLGTLDDFDTLVDTLHTNGIRIIVDIVPNHSGSGHAWFQAALAAGPGSPERDRYIFRDSPDDEPPTPWGASFGGPAWTQVPDGQWYLHLFDPAQPDWNWDNPEVIADFEQTLRFWSDRGVDGFRIDVANLLKKDLSEPLPRGRDEDGLSWATHPRLSDLPSVHEIYRGWRKVFDEYSPPRVAVAEAWVPAASRVAYASPSELGQAFNFDLLKAPFEAGAWRRIITDNLELAARSGSSSTWVLSNHDMVRHVTRFGLPDSDLEGTRHKLSGGDDPVVDLPRGLRRARAATAALLALPGAAYLYQGEELGLPEVVGIPDDQRQDPTFFRSPGVDVGRDGCRVPLPWTVDGTSFGFGTNGSHLPQPPSWGDFSVEAETADPDSVLNFYVEAVSLRHELQTSEELVFKDSAPGVLHFARPGGWECLANFSEASIDLPDSQVVLASGELDGDQLPAETTVWLRVPTTKG